MQMQRMQSELDETRKQLDTVLLQRSAEGTAQLQNESYRAENARLLSLLAKTKEYANFAQFAQDSGQSGVRCMNSNLDGKAPSPETDRKNTTLGSKKTATSTEDDGFGEE